jgi:hypothetical protein
LEEIALADKQREVPATGFLLPHHGVVLKPRRLILLLLQGVEVRLDLELLVDRLELRVDRLVPLPHHLSRLILHLHKLLLLLTLKLLTLLNMLLLNRLVEVLLVKVNNFLGRHPVAPAAAVPWLLLRIALLVAAHGRVLLLLFIQTINYSSGHASFLLIGIFS